MKTTLTGYLSPSIEHLKQLTDIVDNPLLVHNLRAWYLRDATLNTDRIDIVNTAVGRFQAIPANANNTLSYSYQLITINTSLTTLDFSSLPRCIELDLNINTVLQVTNLQRSCKYLLKINFNNYAIENLSDIISLPVGVTWSYFTTNYNYLIIEIEYVNRIFSNILFAELKSPTVSTYVEHTNNIVFDTKLWTSLADASTNAYTGMASGSITFAEGLALQGNRIAYAVDNAFILNEVDFSIEGFLHFTSTSDYGTVFSRWSDTSKQFWMRVDNSKNLLVTFNEGVTTTTLSYDLTTYLNQTLDYLHVLVTRTFNVYKLFLNGILVDMKKSTPFMTTSSANVTIGKLENAISTGDVGNTSFSGVIREIKVCKAIKNNYTFNYVYPKNAHGTNVAFLLQNTLTDRVTTNTPSLTSTVATEPVLGTGNRRNFTLGNYSNQILNKKHHLEYTGNATYEITGNVTIEGWVKNYSGNTRGTILYQGDSSNYNFHLGIYDAALRIDVNNGALSLSGSISILYDTWTHVAYVKEGTDHRLYVNGLYAGNTTSSEVLNVFGYSVPMCIKRYPAQNSVEAGLNTSLYPSKSQIEIEGLRIVKQAVYNGTNTSRPNFLLPGEFSYR